MGRLFLFVGLYSCAATALSPAFCVAGLLPHPCESTHGAPCDHENDCSTDPCNAVYLRPDINDTVDLEPQCDCLHLVDNSAANFLEVGQVVWESPPSRGFHLEILAAILLLI